jgi:hypothetical protein
LLIDVEFAPRVLRPLVSFVCHGGRKKMRAGMTVKRSRGHGAPAFFRRAA